MTALATALAQTRRENDARRFGPPLVGDVRFLDSGVDALLTRRACQYAAVMLAKRGAPAPAGDCEALFSVHLRSVVFFRGGALVAVYRIADHVLDFDPHAPATRERDT